MPPLLIIGAGPAGALAAILLARAGLRVTLIDQHAFPRDKVCGECLSPLALDTLERAKIGLPAAARLTHLALHAPAGPSVTLELMRPMLGLSRLRLDALLIEAAIEAGAAFLPRHRCESLDPLRIRDLAANRPVHMEPGLVLVSDGKSAFVPPRPRETGDLGLKAHFAGVAGPAHTIELFGLQGCYGGLAPIEDGVFNLAIAVPRDRIGADLDRLHASFLAENTMLRQRLAGARRVSSWQVCPLPRFAVRSHWPDHVIPLGNAAAALEPIGGEGMGLALRSAEIAAEQIMGAYPGMPDTGLIRRKYQRLWPLRRLACRTGAIFVSHPSLCAAAVEWLASSESLARMFLALTGKGASPSLLSDRLPTPDPGRGTQERTGAGSGVQSGHGHQTHSATCRI